MEKQQKLFDYHNDYSQFDGIMEQLAEVQPVMQELVKTYSNFCQQLSFEDYLKDERDEKIFGLFNKEKGYDYL